MTDTKKRKEKWVLQEAFSHTRLGLAKKKKKKKKNVYYSVETARGIRDGRYNTKKGEPKISITRSVVAYTF